MRQMTKVSQYEKEGIIIKTKFYQSIKFKIILMTVVVCAVLAVVNTVFNIRASKNSYRELTHNYIYDLAVAYGQEIDTIIAEEGLEKALSPELLKSVLGGVGVEGVEGSYAYIVDGSGIMLYHPTEEKIGSPVENAVVTQLVADLAEGVTHEPDVVEYDYKGALKYASYYMNDAGDYILVISAGEDEMMAPFTSIVAISTGITVLLVIIAAAVVFLLISVILSAFQFSVDSVGKLSELDFTQVDADREKKYIRRKDEMGHILRAVVSLRSKLSEVTGELKSQSSDAYREAEALSASAEDITTSVQEIEKAVAEMASGATMQAEETQRATENVIEIGNMIEANYQNTKVLAEDAGRMKTLGQDANRILNELVEGQHVMVDNINTVYSKTQEANASAKRISEVVELITELASETNLLSLNASIEAARAGEAGRGFAVVAENIKKLAEQTTESATDINAIIQDLESRSDETVDKTNEVRDIVDRQAEDIQRTVKILHNVIDNINTLIGRIDEIAGNIRHMDEAKESVVDVIQNLSAVSEENAAATQETSASTAIVMNAMGAIVGDAVKMRGIAEKLEEEMDKFRL